MKPKSLFHLAGNWSGLVLWLAVLHWSALGQSNYATPYTFTTLAGIAPGSADGTGSAARFWDPQGMAVDGAGNLYVADTFNNTIRKVTPVGTNWVVTTLAGLAGSHGSADGTGSAARFWYPRGVAVDGAGNLYVADQGNRTIRKVTPVGANWVVTTVAGLAGSYGSADGTGFAARFLGPSGVAVDSAGNLYVADTGNDTIREVTPVGTNWVVTTLAGQAGSQGSADGTGSAARFDRPSGVTVDSAGNIYVADPYNNTIREVTPVGTNWVVTTLAGQAGSQGSADGPGSDARFWGPVGVAVDNAGNLYVADTGNATIREVTPVGTDWVVTTLAGPISVNEDGTGFVAQFWGPSGVAVDSAGNVYVADSYNNTIRKVTTEGVVTTLAGLAGTGSGDGPGSAARFNGPVGVAVDSAGNLYVADTGNATIREVTPVGTDWVVTTLAGPISVNPDGTGFEFWGPSGVAVDSAGNLYMADRNNHTIRKVTPVGTNWVVTTLAGLAGSAGSGDGPGSAARFNSPFGVAVDSAGNLYVADLGNNTIRKVTPVGTNWVVTTLAGLAGSHGSADGTGSAARFWYPQGVAVDGAGNLYVADTGNATIREVTPVGTNWVVTTLAGQAGSQGSADGPGSAARFWYPQGVAVDGAGNLYVADDDNNTIREVTPVGTNWVVTTLAGQAGSQGSADGTGFVARFLGPSGVAVDSAGNVYVADTYNNTIRTGMPANSVPAPILQPPTLSTGQFGFEITGLPGLAVNIESSPDMSQWQVVGTYILNDGTNSFVSPAQTEGIQFYRAHVR